MAHCLILFVSGAFACSSFHYWFRGTHALDALVGATSIKWSLLNGLGDVRVTERCLFDACMQWSKLMPWRCCHRQLAARWVWFYWIGLAFVLGVHIALWLNNCCNWMPNRMDLSLTHTKATSFAFKTIIFQIWKRYCWQCNDTKIIGAGKNILEILTSDIFVHKTCSRLVLEMSLFSLTVVSKNKEEIF